MNRRNSSALVAMALATSSLGACSRGASSAPSETRAALAAPPATRAALAASSVTPAAATSGNEPPRVDVAKRTKVTVEAAAMGTRLNFVAITSARLDETKTRAAIDQAVAEIRRLEGLMTTWRDDSEVSQVNKSAGKAPVKVSPETFAVIDKSLWISGVSEGVFDISFEAMRGLWRFDEDADGHPPSAADVAARRKFIDYHHIVVDKEKMTVFLDRAETKISLGGIAKGFAIDRAASLLLSLGVEDFLAQAGGDLYVHGRKPDGSPWVAGVRDPRGPEGSYFAAMPVVDHAFSTAGDYERAYVLRGKRYHHIIDPRTGYPATASRSVTIWAKDALTADALDDAVFILGPTKGLELVESIDGAGAVIVDTDNRVWVSKRLEGLVKIDRPPTGGI